MATMAPRKAAFLPEQVAIDSYGNGGFRFGGMSHIGSLLCLPSGIHGWDAGSFDDVTIEALSLVRDERQDISFLLLGTGGQHRLAAAEIMQAMSAIGIGVEAMDTGSAARTYNVLLAEGRRVGAALIAVD